jgi:hypothetical protein
MKISQSKSGKWYVDFTCQGRRIRRVIGISKQEAVHAMTIIKADILRGKYGFRKTKQSVLFENFAKEYLELYSKLNKRSWRSDANSIKHLTKYFDKKSLARITSELIEKYKSERRINVSAATVN